MAYDTVEKDTNAVLDYGFVWSTDDPPTYTNDGGANDTGWLQGDTITASTWTITVTPVGGTLAIQSSSFTTKVTSVWLTGGGTDGLKFTLVNHITTAGGRQEDRTLVVKIKSK